MDPLYVEQAKFVNEGTQVQLQEDSKNYYNIMYATTSTELGKPRPSLSVVMDKPLLKKRDS